MQQSTCNMTKLRRYDGTSLFVVVPTASLLVVNPVIEYNFLFPRPLLDFILQPWKKNGRRPGFITMSRTRNGGYSQYKLNPHYVVMIPGLLPIFLHSCKIKSGSGLGMRLLCSTTGLTTDRKCCDVLRFDIIQLFQFNLLKICLSLSSDNNSRDKCKLL